MQKRFLWLLAAGLLAMAAAGAAFAQEDVFGPFKVLQINREVVQDVVTIGDDIYVKVAEAYADEEFTVRISQKNGEQYRIWANGQVDMPVGVYATQKRGKKGYLWRINTTAPFVEYWLKDELVLHLERLAE